MSDIFNNTFLLYSKKYPKARLAMYNSDNLGTYEGSIEPSQMWNLRAEPNCGGYVYIENIQPPHRRVARRGPGAKDVKIFCGARSEDQLWKFEKQKINNEVLYVITNRKYPNGKLCKYNQDDSGLGVSKDGVFSESLWRLVPRFVACVMEVPIWTKGVEAGRKECVEEITVQCGVEAREIKSFSRRTGFRSAVEGAIVRNLVGNGKDEDAKEGLMRVLDSSLSYCGDGGASWVSKVTVRMDVAKRYSIVQMVASFESGFTGDEFSLWGEYRVVEE